MKHAINPDIYSLACSNGNSCVEASRATGLAVGLRRKFGFGREIAHYGDGKFSRVLVDLVLGRPRFIEGGFANAMASGDGGAAVHQVLAAILMSEVGYQRQRGCCFGYNVLVVFVEE